MRIIFIVLLTLALILESSLTTLPLVFLVLLTESVYFKDKYVFGFAFIFGVLLDSLALRPLGLSSIYFVVFLLFVLLYQSKLEIKTNNFVIVASFVGSLIFLLLKGYTNNIIIESFTSMIIGLIMFRIIQRANRIE